MNLLIAHFQIFSSIKIDAIERCSLPFKKNKNTPKKNIRKISHVSFNLNSNQYFLALSIFY